MSIMCTWLCYCKFAFKSLLRLLLLSHVQFGAIARCIGDEMEVFDSCIYDRA